MRIDWNDFLQNIYKTMTGKRGDTFTQVDAVTTKAAKTRQDLEKERTK